jgi:type IV secretory pathway protease TraF
MLKSILCLVVGAMTALWFQSHYTLNESASEPLGWYQIMDRSLNRNSLVLLRNPLKRLVGVPGDTVQFTPEGVYVNGAVLPNSAVPAGSPYPPYHPGSYTLQADQYLVMGQNPLSWDSRYEGPIPGVLITSTVKPLRRPR